jgi:hypothetical protein
MASNDEIINITPAQIGVPPPPPPPVQQPPPPPKILKIKKSIPNPSPPSVPVTPSKPPQIIPPPPLQKQPPSAIPLPIPAPPLPGNPGVKKTSEPGKKIPDWKLKQQQQKDSDQKKIEELMKWDFRKGDLEDEDWSVINHFRLSSEGSSGVFFVDRPSGTTVIKGSMTMAAEIFTSRIAKYVGIISPNIRLVDYSSHSSSEWGTLKNNVITWTKKESTSKYISKS